MIDKLIFMGCIYEKCVIYIILWNKYYIVYVYIKWYVFIMIKCIIKLDLIVNKIYFYYNILLKDYNVCYNYFCVFYILIMFKIYIVLYFN